MSREAWFKKDVELRWRGQKLSFAVAQELFSSHAVDVGSRLLLRSLEPDQHGRAGTALDFGCGYGVLGLAWKSVKPEWKVHLVDRDALAVEFSQWNAERLGFEQGDDVSCTVGLGPGGAPPHGFDLILWNVPGKAGEAVLRRLAGDIADALGTNGLAALVIVNPLAAVLRSAYQTRTDLTVTVDEAHADHTILHIRKNASTENPGTPVDAFERGVFDREMRTFHAPVGSYDLTPVIGLPEYESHSYETTLLLSALERLSPSPGTLLVVGCGQGHVPVAAHLMHGTMRFTLIDRDLLALAASARTLAGVGVVPSNVRGMSRSAIGSVESTIGPVDTAIVRLEDQIRPSVMDELVGDLEVLSDGTLTVLVGGGSTSVSRLLRIAAKRPAWKLKSRDRKHGASAAIMTIG